ncbi:MAG: hypothetical protein WDM87_03175 [Terracidiphilus sp.]
MIADADHPRGKHRFKFPTECPECRSKVVRAEGEADWRCINVDCPAKAAREPIALCPSRSHEHRGAGRRGGAAVGGKAAGQERCRSLLA